MYRRSLFRVAPALLGVATVGGLSATAANAEPRSESQYINSVAEVLGISFEEAADLWSNKEYREVLPVSERLLDSTPSDNSLTATSDAVALATTNYYRGSKTFNNLFGNELMRVTVRKTVYTMSVPVRPVSAYVETHSTTLLGKTAWVAEGPTSAYDVDEARSGGSHYSRRAASWTARGSIQGRVTLGVGILAKVGNLHSISGYKW